LRQTEEARVEALMRGEAAPSQSTAEQILKYDTLAVFVAHQVRRRAAELAEWDEDDKAGGAENQNAPNGTAALSFVASSEAARYVFVVVVMGDVILGGRRYGTFVLTWRRAAVR